MWIEMNHLPGLWIDQPPRAGQPLETRRAEQRGFGHFHRASFVNEPLTLLLESLQLIAGESSPDARGQRAGQQNGKQGESADGRPALPGGSRVFFFQKPGIVDPLAEEIDIFIGQGAQAVGVRGPGDSPPRRHRGLLAIDHRIVFPEVCCQRCHGSSVPRYFISTARSLALRDGGLSKTSLSEGVTGCLVSTSARPSRPRLRNFSLTFLSSRDMKEIITILPPGMTSPGAISTRLSSSRGSSLTTMRSAMNVRVAGCRRPVRGTARSTTPARCSVLRMGRARTIALAIFRALPSSPRWEIPSATGFS